MRIMFEVQDLRYATLATVSRCGMVWFSEDVLSNEMIFDNYLMKLRNVAVEEGDDSWVRPPTATASGAGGADSQEEEVNPQLQVGHCCNLCTKCCI